jgi:murein DD-endopeptidase MepM/ murein hydrolase activator NlpD
MRWPLDNFIETRGYSTGHPAYDLANFRNTPGKAPEDGVVTSVENRPDVYFGGRYVVMVGESGHRHYMGHNEKNHVRVGQLISEGQHILDVGSSGQATGPHIHHEVSKGGQTIDFRTLLTSEAGEDMGSTVGEVEFHDLYIAFFGPMSLNPPSEHDRKRWIGKETNTVIREMQEDPRYFSYNKYVTDLEHAQGGSGYEPVAEQLFRKKG